MQTTVIETVANSLPENEVILFISPKLGNGKKRKAGTLCKLPPS